MSSPDDRGKHSLSHTFWPIVKPAKKDEYFAAQSQKQLNEEKSMHLGVTCNACDQRNIRGVRFKCLNCQGTILSQSPLLESSQLFICAVDYDLCSRCMSSPLAREKHSVAHSFFPIEIPGDKKAFYSAKLQRHLATVPDDDAAPSGSQNAMSRIRAEELYRSTSPVHLGINCDTCLSRNITGVRFKCMQCEGEYTDSVNCSNTQGVFDSRFRHVPNLYQVSNSTCGSQ